MGNKKPTHTPGPWTVDDISIHGPDGWNVANAACRSRTSETQEANARLIAAAPDLLDALRSAASCMMLQQVLERGRGDKTASGWDAPIAQARAAIVKADGE